MMAGALAGQFEKAEALPGQPIPIRPAVAEPGEYPLEALSGRLQAAARAIIDKVQVPAAIAAQSVLAAAALATQAYIDVELPTGEVAPTSLFFATVAASGARKSSVDKLALRAVRLREHEMHEDFAGAQAKYLSASAAYQAARKKAQTGSKSRAEIEAALDACGTEPVAPPQPMLVSDEGTLQGLQRLFAEAMPSLGLFSDEGGQWLGGFAMNEENRGATGAALSKLWDGAPIKRVRGTDGFTILRGRRLSVHLMLQERIAKRMFGDKDLKDQGLLSRVLACQPATMMGQRFWRAPTEDSRLDLEKYDARLLGLLRSGMPMDPDTRALKPTAIPLSEAAKELWVHFHDAVENQLKKGGTFEPISGFAGKLPEHACRIAAVMAFFENKRVEEISDQALAAGIKIAQFHANEALRLFGLGGGSDDTDNAASIIDFIREEGLPIVGTRYLARSKAGRKMDGQTLKRAVELLVSMNHLVPIAGGAEMTVGLKKPAFYREAYTVIADPTEDEGEA